MIPPLTHLDDSIFSSMPKVSRVYAPRAMSEEKNKKKPWDVPKSGYNKTIFTLNNPFVTLCDLDSASVGVIKGDKVGDGNRMDDSALDMAIEKITDAPFAAAKSYKGGRIIHGAMILDLYKVTKPREVRPATSPVQLADQVSGYNEGSQEELTDISVTEIENELGDEVELKIKTPELLYESDSIESNASVELRHEGDDPDDSAGDEKTRYDFKESASFNKLFQAAAYVARKDAFLNMDKGRYEPIFLESWGKLNWKYGVFFLFGVVTLKDGVVSSVSSKHLYAPLSTMLDKANVHLREYLGDPEAVYPDGRYVHGLLYTNRGDFLLPDMTIEGSGDLPDTELFFQSLMRIVCGDTVLSWKVNRVKERLDARQMNIDAARRRWRKRRRTMP